MDWQMWPSLDFDLVLYSPAGIIRCEFKNLKFISFSRYFSNFPFSLILKKSVLHASSACAAAAALSALYTCCFMMPPLSGVFSFLLGLLLQGFAAAAKDASPASPHPQSMPVAQSSLQQVASVRVECVSKSR